MQLHERIFKELFQIKPQEKGNTATESIKKYLIDLDILKNKDLQKYEYTIQFEQISSRFYKALFQSEKNQYEKLDIFNPLVHFLINQKHRQVTKTILRALYHTYKKYLQLMDDKKLYIEVSELLLENIDYLDLIEFSVFAKHVKCHLAKNKDKAILKVQDIFEQCAKTKNKQMYLAGVEMIYQCGLHHKFDLDMIQKGAINIGIAQEYFNIIKKDKDKCIRLMNNLSYEIHSSIQKKIINQHRLNYKNFPDLVKFQSLKNLNYMYKSDGLEKVEDRFTVNSESFVLLLDYLINKMFMNDAYSVFFRNKNLLQKDKREYYENIFEQDKCIYRNNLLIDNNFFGPASISLDIKGEKEYLTLKYLGYQQQDVFLINESNIQQPEFYLKDVDTVGLDCEFYQEDFSNFAHHKLATFQMATHKNVYIFDCINLQNSQKFKDLFIYLFQCNTILKIGHTFDGDIKVFEDTFKVKIKYKRNLQNVEKLYSKQALSLAKLVHMFFDKELCKFEQTSNWQRQPLRQTQIHYAALDAAILLSLYKKLSQTAQKVNKDIINKPNNLYQQKVPVEQKKDELKQNYINELEENGNMAKFYADNMLEKLARQLRNLGYDTKFDKNAKKVEIFQICEKEQRILLTTNNKYLVTNQIIVVHKVRGKRTKDQVKNVIKAFPYNLKSENLHTRCIECNNDSFYCKDKQEIKEDFKSVNYVQPSEVDEFWVCKNCTHIFWKGSQYQKSQQQFLQYIGQQFNFCIILKVS